MLTVYSDDHALQDGKAELIDGRLVPCFEMPRRAFLIRDRVEEVGLGAIVPPTDLGRAPIERVHTTRFRRVPRRRPGSAWTASGRDYDALPLVWPTRTSARSAPERIDGLLGRYSFDAGTPITAGTWRAAYGQRAGGADRGRAASPTASTAAAFALCRPPGHHAAADLYGGYCFLNNAAIAAQFLIDRGAERVAILDVDYHHGNGTQAIFYDRPDVLFLSLHGRSARGVSRIFLGFADETGAGAGRGLQRQLPAALGHGLRRLVRGAGGRAAAGSPTTHRTSSWSRSASTPSRTTRSRSSGSRATISPPTAPGSPRSACRPCSSWRAATRSSRSASTRSTC